MAAERRSGKPERAVTLRAVAERAGVTAATVSYVLRGHQQRMRISDECTARVRAAAEELGYRGHYHAQALSLGRSNTIGLAVGSGPVSVLRSDFWAAISSGVESEARARGYDLLLIGGAETLEPLERAIGHLAQRRIDALVVLRGIYPKLPAELLRPGFPAVVISPRDTPRTHRVEFDPAPGFAQAARRLANLGHRRMLWLGESGPGMPDYIAVREACCRAAAAAAGIGYARADLASVPPTGASAIDSYRIALAAAPLPVGTTAVICQSDLLALALCADLAARGVRVPEQVSVIGFDDLYGENAVPALSTISQALPEQGRAAVAIATDLAEGKPLGRPEVRTVPSFLIARASIGPSPTDRR